MALSARHACLSAAALFAGLAALIARLALAPLGAADLLGIAACAAASGAFATLAFTLRPSAASAAPVIDADALAAQISTALDARLAAAEEIRVADLLRAAQAARPEPVAPALSTDAIAAPAAASAKPRLGRGLAGLMHNPSALSRPAEPAPAPADDADAQPAGRAAA